MQTDPLAPAIDTPPRTLHEWTTVRGHMVIDVGRGRARCSCGERQPIHELLRHGRLRVGHGRELTPTQRAEIRAAAASWRDAHLANAWPILMQPVDGETDEQFARRVGQELAATRAERERLEQGALAGGDVIPVLGEAELAVGMRAAVLKHQYQQLALNLQRKHEINGTGDAIKWMVESIGDPMDEL